MLTGWWDWLKNKGRSTHGFNKDKTVMAPAAQQASTAPSTQQSGTIPDTHVYTPQQAAQAAARARTKAIPFATLQQLMQQLGPEDKMNVTPKGYFVTTKPGSPPRTDLPADVFGSVEDRQEDEE